MGLVRSFSVLKQDSNSSCTPNTHKSAYKSTHLEQETNNRERERERERERNAQTQTHTSKHNEQEKKQSQKRKKQESNRDRAETGNVRETESGKQSAALGEGAQARE